MAWIQTQHNKLHDMMVTRLYRKSQKKAKLCHEMLFCWSFPIIYCKKNQLTAPQAPPPSQVSVSEIATPYPLVWQPDLPTFGLAF